MSFKIIGGTESGETSLCHTCRKSHIFRNQSSASENVICNANMSQPFEVKNRIVQCSLYSDSRRPTVWDMEQLAWQIRTDKSGKTIGFKSPRDNEIGGQPATIVPGFIQE